MVNKIVLAIRVGVGAVTLAFCSLFWGIWKLRHRVRTGQISAMPVQNTHSYPIAINVQSNCMHCLREFMECNSLGSKELGWRGSRGFK